MEKKQIEWRPVKEYEGQYEVSNVGEVKSLHKCNYNNILKQRIDRGGYQTVRLYKKGLMIKTMFVHRMVATAFIPIVEDKPFINHIDGDKLNNNVENLERCTHSENMIHAYKNNLICKIPKKVFDNCTGIIYNSISEASRICDVKYNTLVSYLNGLKNNPTCLQYLI